MDKLTKLRMEFEAARDRFYVVRKGAEGVESDANLIARLTAQAEYRRATARYTAALMHGTSSAGFQTSRDKLSQSC